MARDNGLNEFSLGIIGLNTRHIVGSIVSVPQGSSQCMLMQFCTPVRVNTAEGFVAADRGDCLILSPYFPRLITAIDENSAFANNWLFFNCDNLENLLQSYGLEPNILVHDLDPVEIINNFQVLLGESIQRLPYSQRKCELAFEQMLLHLGREETAVTGMLTAAEREYKMTLSKLRTSIYAEPCELWRVPMMARSVAMSEAWFNRLYKKLYSITPMQDVIKARIACAKNKLVDQNGPLNIIARESGFQNEFYFAKIFKKNTGLTPGAYRTRTRKQ